MADKIVNPNNYDWQKVPRNKGVSKYDHLLDGNAREIDVRDYNYDEVANFRIMIMSLVRNRNLVARSMKLNDYTLLFQVTGKKE